jgi:hypothetical protein
MLYSPIFRFDQCQLYAQQIYSSSRIDTLDYMGVLVKPELELL